MAQQPEDRAAELLNEMGALLESAERDLEDGRRFREDNGLDDAALKQQVARLPEDKRAEMQQAVEADMREIEDDVAQAKLASSHAPRSGGAKRPKMRPMI